MSEMMVTVEEACRETGRHKNVIYDRMREGKVKWSKAQHKNGSGRTAWVKVVDLPGLIECLAAEDRELREKKEQVMADRLARKEERKALRALRDEQLRQDRTGAAAAIVKGAATKSVKQLARELGISTAEVKRIYEEEGCL